MNRVLKRGLALLGMIGLVAVTAWAIDALVVNADGSVTVNGDLNVDGDINQSAGYGGLVPVGTILPYAGTTLPAGWLWCYGQQVSRLSSGYPELYAVIGHAFKPSNQTPSSNMFFLPDLRGVFLRGAGEQRHGQPLDPEFHMADGSRYDGGDVGDTIQDQFQGHYHLGQGGNSSGGSRNAMVRTNNGSSGFGPTAPQYPGAQAPVTGADGLVRSGDETRPASVSVNYIIKY